MDPPPPPLDPAASEPLTVAPPLSVRLMLPAKLSVSPLSLVSALIVQVRSRLPNDATTLPPSMKTLVVPLLGTTAVDQLAALFQFAAPPVQTAWAAARRVAATAS